MGDNREVRLYYRPRAGRNDSTEYLRFRVKNKSLLRRPDGTTTGSIADFFDFSVYVDADTDLLRAWYVDRFLRLRETAFADPSSYFHRYAALSDTAARERALAIWGRTNEPNLRENILPTRERARLVLEKGPDHTVTRIRLRKL